MLWTKITGGITFLLSDPATHSKCISTGVKDFTVKNISPLTGVLLRLMIRTIAMRSGMDMYPLAGELIIRHMLIMRFLSQEAEWNVGGIFMMMGPRTQKKRLYSNAVK